MIVGVVYVTNYDSKKHSTCWQRILLSTLGRTHILLSFLIFLKSINGDVIKIRC